MTEVHFYHLTRSSLEDALPPLLEKTLERQWRAVVMAASPERVEQLTHHLWMYRSESFLPHGSAKDGFASEQPIWLTTADERPNNADVLFLTEGASSERLGDYTRVCEIFDGNDPYAVKLARERWGALKVKGYALNYWQQNEKGWANSATSA